MSEYQHIEFRAVDRPLTDKELVFARKQSSRAEITPWSFRNFYTFGDFHGDSNGLLRKGYDVHLHYADFGIRKIALRLPNGLPFSKRVWSQYIGAGDLEWTSDRRGSGGILTLAPYHEPGELEDLHEFDTYVHALIEIRSRILCGDLGALYLLWLVAAIDSEEESLSTVEPPVPAGLEQDSNAFRSFLEFFDFDPLLLTAAAENSLELHGQVPQQQYIEQWVASQDEAEARSLLKAFLTKDPIDTKAKAMAEIGATRENPGWPVVTLGRTCSELLDRAAKLRRAVNEKKRKQRAAAKKRKEAKEARERQERMQQMVVDPHKWLRKASQLVSERGTANYEAAAELLGEVREALAGEGGEEMTHKHAAHLAKKYPTLSRMKSSLRKRGLLG